MTTNGQRSSQPSDKGGDDEQAVGKKGSAGSPDTTEPPGRLSAEDWIRITLDEWSKGDAPSITINALARRLGVTKGSFYWHFDSRDDLLQRALDEWRRKTTTQIIERLREFDGHPRALFEHVLELTKHDQANKYSRIEETIRSWALADRLAAAIVEAADDDRVRFLADIFAEAGCSTETARQRGYLAYCMLVGDARLRHTTDEMWRASFRQEASECLLPEQWFAQ